MRSFLIALVVVGSLFVAPATAASPDAPDPLNETATVTPDNQVSIQLSEVVELESWSYQDGEFRLRIDSDLATEMVVTDSGDLVRRVEDGGTGTYEVSERRYDLEEGTQTIVFDAERYKGAAAITIGTRGGSYLIQSGSTSSGLTSGPYPLGTLQIAVFSGALSVALVIVYKTYRYSKGDDLEPERVA